MTFSELCLWQIAISKMSNYDRLHCLHGLHCHHSDNHHHQLHHSHWHHCWNCHRAYDHDTDIGNLQEAFFCYAGLEIWFVFPKKFANRCFMNKRAVSWTQPRMFLRLFLAFLTNIFVIGSQLWTVRGDLLKIIKEGQTGSLPVESHHSWFLFWPNWPAGGVGWVPLTWSLLHLVGGCWCHYY